MWLAGSILAVSSVGIALPGTGSAIVQPVQEGRAQKRTPIRQRAFRLRELQCTGDLHLNDCE